MTGSFSRAFLLFSEAAAAGNAKAQFHLGMMYLRGRGTPENLGEAQRWFRQAAKHGDPDAQVQLGTMYQCGYGVEIDLAQARHWFELAAKQGHGAAVECLKTLEVV